MKANLVAAVALLSNIAIALPNAVPAKFAIQITADLGNGPTSLFLGKDRRGGSVASVADAAPCSITTRNYLSCDGRTMGASSNRAYSGMGIPEVAPIVATGDPGSIVDGYSVDAAYGLHWKSEKFPAKVMTKKAEGGQDGEAIFGLAKATEDGSIKLVQLLGLKNATFPGFDKVAEGTAKVVPL